VVVNSDNSARLTMQSFSRFLETMMSRHILRRRAWTVERCSGPRL
jgi:hypothetical protein